MMPVSIDTLILPGLNGSADDHWQQHWVRDRKGSRIVRQDDWAHPDRQSWRSRLESCIEETRKDVWLVAHSLGCLLAADLAESRLVSRVRGALLVAPCDLEATERMHPGAISFGSMPLGPLPFPSLIIGSLNDPYMPVERLKKTAEAWGGGLIDIGEAGHINIAAGFGRWKAGYDFFKVLQISTERPPLARRAGSDAKLAFN